MWRAYVEADSGEQLRIIRSDTGFGGKAVLAFLTTFSNYLDHIETDKERLADTINWFDELDRTSKQGLKELLDPLEKSYYIGDWGDYTLDEWEFFIRRNKIKINQWEFEQALANIQEKWTLINKLLKSVTCLVEILENNNLRPANWYYPEATIPEFKGLQQTLEILKERRARTVRIKFI